MHPILRRFTIIAFGVLAIARSAPAQPLGSSFTYQGQLKVGGSPANGLHDMRYRLYDAASGGAQIGATECLNDVSVLDGVFTVSLNFGPQFAGDARFLEVEVRANTGLDCTNAAGFIVLGPRQAIAPTPYALHALNASISGTQSNAVSFTNPANTYAGSGAALTGLNAGSITSGTLGSAHLGGSYANIISLTNNANTISGASFGSFFGDGSGLIDDDAHTFDGQNVDAFLQEVPSPLLLTSTDTVNGTIRANNTGVGAGATGVYGLASANGAENYGVYGQSDSTHGFGVRGVANASDDQASSAGVYGSSSGESGVGVQGLASGDGGVGVTGGVTHVNGVGVYGYATATAGSSAGVSGTSEAATGAGVRGFAFANGAENYGVYGQSNSTHGFGVRGIANASDVQAPSAGVYGSSSGFSGTGIKGNATGDDGVGVEGGVTHAGANAGVFGFSAATTGSSSGVNGTCESPAGRGVSGAALANAGVNYGVRGQTNSPAGYGVYSVGNTGASGTKAFRIDHPHDPANKYLLHYSIESNEVLNAYSGKAVLNGAGEAVIELPPYFAKINKDPRYTLTAIGTAMPNVHVAIEIDETTLKLAADASPEQIAPPCWFKIAGGVPGAKVSWEVKAVRNDRWMQQHGAPVELEKNSIERGTYQHPHLYQQADEIAAKARG